MFRQSLFKPSPPPSKPNRRSNQSTMYHPSHSKPSPPTSNPPRRKTHKKPSPLKPRRRSNNKRSRRRRTNGQKSSVAEYPPSNISLTDYIPSDLLMEVLSHVASNSITDLLNFKKTCKLVSESASERHVLQNAAVLDKYFFHGRFGLDDKNNFSNFMARCMDSDNNEALFCHGIEDYFRGDGGVTLKLRAAAEKGTKVARYAYGMFTLLTEEDPTSVEEGFRFLRGLRKVEDVVECRETVKYVVRRNMWVDDVYRNHRLFRGSGRSIYGGRCGCNREGRSLASFSKNSDFEWLEIEEQVSDLVDSGLCDSCFWKFEACVLLKGCTGSLKN